MRQGLAFYHLNNDGADPIPRASHFSNHHNCFWRETVDQHGDSPAQITGHAIQRLERLQFALLRKLQNVLESRRPVHFSRMIIPIARRSRLGVITNGRGSRSKNFPATAVATTTSGTIFLQGNMAKFTSQTGRSAGELAIQNHAYADTFS